MLQLRHNIASLNIMVALKSIEIVQYKLHFKDGIVMLQLRYDNVSGKI
jgi:hypothetical protein